MANRVYHWKHGWIPLDSVAAAEKTHKTLSSSERANARKAWTQKHADELGDTKGGVTFKQQGGWRMASVAGRPGVQFQEPVEFDKRPPKQYREVADAVTDVLKPYPRAAKDPIIISFSPEMDPEVMADTNNSFPHKIRVNTIMWDRPNYIQEAIDRMKENSFGISAQVSGSDPLMQFRKNVITHELGHVLHMRDLDEVNQASFSKMDDFGKIQEFTQEPVTPRQMGYHVGAPDADIDMEVPRWMADSLGFRSAYATQSNFEFFAEAFLDGTLNHEDVSPSGKRAVRLAKDEFGPGSPTVRDRLYGKGGGS